MGLKDLRLASGYTQEEFAKYAKVGEYTVRKIERDYREIYKASDPTLMRLMDALDCRLVDLFKPDESKYKRVDHYQHYNRKK